MTYLFGTISDVQGIDFPRLIIDGFFVFFSISMVSTICFEFYFDHTIKSNKYVNIVIVLFSIILVLISMVGYAYIYVAKNFTNTININITAYKTIQLWVFFIAALLTYALKAITYYTQYIDRIRRRYI
ncbi:hypothetical protein GCM10011386_33320 [Parapedobacter defluvii]|uniref:Uncharacterized protein n=1 Tax=Parapedobacter defluvii TaxID=2045106 RepID=A0ABQ1MG78_9SPHI|nr:hypothetical protein GCM10011386_33320 [Parapedobacter defluvii]